MTECVQATIAEVVLEQKKLKQNGRTISEETTKVLFEKRKKEFSKNKPTAKDKDRKKWNKKIKNSCR